MKRFNEMKHPLSPEHGTDISGDVSSLEQEEIFLMKEFIGKNSLIKKAMAEELLHMGLSGEAVERILHVKIKD